MEEYKNNNEFEPLMNENLRDDRRQEAVSKNG